MSEQPVFVDPWWDLRCGSPTEHRQREALATELRNEVAAGHPLHRVSFEVIARSEATDDIIIELTTGGWAKVHLTWQGPDRPPWPTTTIYNAIGALEEDLRLSR
ncbi:hypothetical protein [Pseudofrankia sp. DC12]|uniref:hypothetical protein n=1 Tax=Pseudofrankia sp. DC12 TaxID=683315 RepID=UPI0009FBC7A1|nr:hypothetical protein [Pseudofrankia sp. DC12]